MYNGVDFIMSFVYEINTVSIYIFEGESRNNCYVSESSECFFTKSRKPRPLVAVSC